MNKVSNKQCLLVFGFHAAPPLRWIFSRAVRPSDLPSFLLPLPNASAWMRAAELMNSQSQTWWEFFAACNFPTALPLLRGLFRNHSLLCFSGAGRLTPPAQLPEFMLRGLRPLQSNSKSIAVQDFHQSIYTLPLIAWGTAPIVWR